MATPVNFDPFLGWVNSSDPNSIPQDARIIMAEDLLRYEHFGQAAAGEINRIATDLEPLVQMQTEFPLVQQSLGAHNARLLLLEKPGVITRTTNYTADAADDIIIGNGTSMTITLPAASTATGSITVKNRHSTALTVASAGGTIDGAANKTLAQWASATFISDSTNWYVI